jgi:hypothetical protein
LRAMSCGIKGQHMSMFGSSFIPLSYNLNYSSAFGLE